MGAFDDLIPAASQGAGGSFDDLIPKADPKIGQPEQLTWAEKNLAPALEWLGLKPATKGGNVGGFLRGAADPAVAAAQLAANALPGDVGANMNRWVSDQEKQYQDARAIEGRGGVDVGRGVGNFVATLPLAGIGSGVRAGAAVGAASGALNPVNGGDFWAEKGKDVAIGAAGGAVMSPVLGALARIVSPRASVDPAVKMLRDEGVEMSLGQALGGVANQIEQKATSVPLLGDAIGAARRRGIESFNTAAVNRSIAPVGSKVSGSGHEAVAEAGDILSDAYQGALGQVNHINFNTPTFNANFGQLQQMASGLSEPLAKRFNSAVNDVVLRKMSPNGSILGADLKLVDSELGNLARRYSKSSVASEQELGDALLQLRQIVKDEVGRSAPNVAQALKAADTGWANLVRVEGAAKAAANNEGVFTPAQLMNSIKANSSRVRGRDVSRGEGLMQDLAGAGQRLGTKVPDSGTVGRLANIGAIASAAAHPAIPLALGASAVMYTPQVQNILRAMVLRRPDQAPAMANYLRQLSTPAALGLGPLMQGNN